MTRRIRMLLALLCALIPFGCDGGCGCSDEGVLAELDTTTGSVERDEAARQHQWAAAEPGAEFHAGDGLKTGPEAEALLDLAAGGRVRVEADTIIRFRDSEAEDDASGLDVEMGDAVLLAGEEPLRLATEVGVAVIEAGAAMRVSRREGGLAFAVTVGRARLETEERTEELGAGDSIEVGIGEAKLDPRLDAGSPEDAGQDGALPPLPSDVTARVEGPGASVLRAGETGWQPLPPGEATLQASTQVRLARGTTMSVVGGGQTARLQGAGQFVVLGAEGSLVQVLGGSASVGGSGRVRVQAPGGTILTQGDGSADIAVGQDGTTTVAVGRGAVEVAGKIDRARVIAGERAELDREGTVKVEGRALDYADLVLPAGASGVVHDPSPPTAIGLVADGCDRGAVVQLLQHGKRSTRVRGAKQTNLPVVAGRHEYEVHCVGEEGIEEAATASGAITVVADAGTAPLPRSAPTTQVAADGRNYTVLYQNLLPKIGISWNGAPEASRYQLTVTSNGRTKTHSTTTPAYNFSSGALSEGTHRLLFTTADGARSKTTTVRIRFDNAAPKASLRAPANRSFSPGQSVSVAGIALPGWKVTANGTSLPTDGQHRFHGKTTAPASQRSLAVAFSHPSRGTHYYLRRSEGTP